MAVTPNAAPTGYNSAYTGPQIDAAVGAVIDKETAWDEAAAGKLPAGGEVGQVLEKTGAEDNAAEWRTPPFLVRPNLLDNWYFIGGGSQDGDGLFPINQRGQASYSGDVACFDRWAMRSSGAAVTLTETGLILTSSAQTGGIIYQMIENPKLLLGKKVCYSLLAGGNLYSGAAQFDAAAPSGNKTVLTVPINDGFSLRIRHLANGGIEVGIIRNGGTLSDIQAIKLELGDTQTLAHQEGGNWVLNELPDYGEELAKCQRYYLPLMEFVRYNATLRTANLVDFTIPTPVTMAGSIKMVAPNIKIYSYVEGETALKEQTGFSFSTDSDGSIIATATGSGNGIVTIRATKNGHGLLANPCILLFPGSGAYLTVT